MKTTNTNTRTIRTGQLVAWVHGGGQWKVINREIANEQIHMGRRYFDFLFDIQNKATGEVARMVRAKDLILKGESYYAEQVNG